MATLSHTERRAHYDGRARDALQRDDEGQAFRAYRRAKQLVEDLIYEACTEEEAGITLAQAKRRMHDLFREWRHLCGVTH